MSDSTKLVTRVEIADIVADVFQGTPVHRDRLIDTAIGNRARPQVIELLQSLPARRFAELRQLWEVLRDVPVEVAIALKAERIPGRRG